MIDPLNIFKEVKNILKEFPCIKNLYAVGSRISGLSKSGNWDFDILIEEDIPRCQNIRKIINNHFENRVDEFNKPIKFDVFTIPIEYIEEFLKTLPHQSL